jgi:hypothetical protein
MRLAYSISGYKLPNQFAWLMTAIRHADDLFIVHVDARTPAPVFAAMRGIAGEADNIVFIDRQPVTWMGISLVEVELRAIRTALATRPSFDYLISLSMQDYPLKSRAEIVAALEAEPGRDYVTFEKLSEQPFHMRRRPWLWCFERNGRLQRTIIPRLMPRDLQIAWKGPWWRILSRETCAWLIESPLTERYLAYLKNVQAPDEFFFQNLLMRGLGPDRLADGYRHFISWPGNSASPETLTMARAELLMASPMWYARKFDETMDEVILERLAERIGAELPPHVIELRQRRRATTRAAATPVGAPPG